MGVPRNHVSVGNIGNPFEGVSKSFNDISKTFFDEAQREIDNARNKRVDEENIRQFDKQQAIRDAEEGRSAAKYQVGIDKSNFLRDMSNFDDTELRNKRLRDIGKLSEEQLQGEAGDQARALVKLGRKEVSDYIKQLYNKQYGRTLAEGDLDAMLSRYTDYATLQSNADATNRQQYEDRYKDLELRIEAAKAAKSSSSGGSGGSRPRGGKVISSFDDIDTKEIALEFNTEDAAFLVGRFGADDSSASDIHPNLRTAREVFAKTKDKNGNLMHPQVGYMLLKDAAREFSGGDKLNRFRSRDSDEFAKYITELEEKFIANPKKYYDRAFGFSSKSGMPKELLDIVTDIASKGPAPYKSRNIQSERNAALNSGLDKLLGRSKPAPVKSPKPGSSKDVDEKILLEKLGISGTSGVQAPFVEKAANYVVSNGLTKPEPVLSDVVVSNIPKKYNEVISSLDPSVKQSLDLDWPKRTIRSLRTNGKGLNDAEVLSKEFLEASLKMKEKARLLDIYKGRKGPSYRPNAVKKYTRQLQDAQINLARLKEMLVNR